MSTLPRLNFWFAFSAAFLVLASCSSIVLADPVDDYIRLQMKKHQLPGLSLAVVRAGKPVKTQGYGVANLETQTPVSEHTVFEIGSITKQFTAVLVLMLAQEKKLGLDDKLASHFQVPIAWKDITIRQLLNHTSGLKNYTALPGFSASRRMKAPDFIKALSAYPLDFDPGESWAYSNSGYNLLGYLLEKQSGQTYWDLLNTRILRPLNMSATTSRDPRVIIPQWAAGYEWQGNQLRNRDPNLTDVFAAGAIASSVLDLVKWCSGLDSDQLLKSSQRELLWQPARLAQQRTYPYGFGWRLEDYKGHKNLGHSGSTAGFSSSLQRFPADQLTVIILCNISEQGLATTLARDVAELYFRPM